MQDYEYLEFEKDLELYGELVEVRVTSVQEIIYLKRNPQEREQRINRILTIKEKLRNEGMNSKYRFDVADDLDKTLELLDVCKFVTTTRTTHIGKYSPDELAEKVLDMLVNTNALSFLGGAAGATALSEYLNQLNADYSGKESARAKGQNLDCSSENEKKSDPQILQKNIDPKILMEMLKPLFSFYQDFAKTGSNKSSDAGDGSNE
jgi:hypothetical protein